MDTLSHALIGAAVCSRTGLAGGLRGPWNKRRQRPGFWHWSLGMAFLWGLFPDAFSLGPHLVAMVLGGQGGRWFPIPEHIMLLYHITHSLLISFAIIVAVFRFRPEWAIPMLAWPLHIVCDIFTHGPGIFQTHILYPVSSFYVKGVNWWEYPWISYGTWITTAVLWLAIIAVRYRSITGGSNESITVDTANEDRKPDALFPARREGT